MHNSNKTFSWRICLWVLVVVAVFYAAALLEIRPIAKAICPNLEGENGFGVFGDSTAVLNTFFSALAFGGVLITIFIQLAMTKRQAEENRITKFENVYFNMTQTFETIVDGLSKHISYDAAYIEERLSRENEAEVNYNDNLNIYNLHQSSDADSKYLRGRDVFLYVYDTEKVRFEDDEDNAEDVEDNEQDDEQNKWMTRKEILKRHPNCFDEISVVELHHYFRYLYRILKYIDDSELIFPLEKYKYAAMLRAQLSCYELVMLYYDGLSESGRNLKPLIEKYAMLDNLDMSLLATEYIHTSDVGYKESADDSNSAKSKLENDSRPKEEKLQIVSNVLLYFLLPIFAIFFFMEKWYKYVVDVLLQRIPNENVSFMLLLIVGAILAGMEIYKKGNILSKKLYSVEILLSFSIIICSYIADSNMSENYKWYGVGSFAYASLIPLAAVAYILYWALGKCLTGESKETTRKTGKEKTCHTKKSSDGIASNLTVEVGRIDRSNSYQ